MPQLSVVMPVYNGEVYLAEAIESILEQTFTDFELIVVDDGSQDASADIIRSYEKADSRVRLLLHDQNLGQASTLNTGIAASTGAFIAQQDCDDISRPERLCKQICFLESHPEIGGVGTSRQVFNQDLSTLLYRFALPQQHALIALNWFTDSISLGATLMMRRGYLLAVGGYETGLSSCQDLDLESRLLQQTSIRFAGLPEYLYVYRRHDRVREKGPGSQVFKEKRRLRRRVLMRLWDEAPEVSIERMYQLLLRKPLSWAERRATKRDLLRLVESLIAASWVEPDDRQLLLAAIDRRLEQTCPRLWQQFCHWRRHHFPRLFPDTLREHQ